MTKQDEIRSEHWINMWSAASALYALIRDEKHFVEVVMRACWAVWPNLRRFSYPELALN